jgi:hypothetical protein
MVKILQTIDGLLYDVVLWVVLIPKTLVKIIIAPTWAVSYVRLELKKDATQRYEAYMPPVLFFILTGILPFLIVGRFTCLCPDSAFTKFNKLSLESNILILALLYISPPLIYSLVILKCKRRSIGRSTLRPVLHTQCLLWAAYYVLSVPIMWFYIRGAAGYTQVIADESVKIIAGVIGFVLIIWFIYAESRVILRELHRPILALGITIFCYIISTLLIRSIFYLVEQMVT